MESDGDTIEVLAYESSFKKRFAFEIRVPAALSSKL